MITCGAGYNDGIDCMSLRIHTPLGIGGRAVYMSASGSRQLQNLEIHTFTPAWSVEDPRQARPHTAPPLRDASWTAALRGVPREGQRAARVGTHWRAPHPPFDHPCKAALGRCGLRSGSRSGLPRCKVTNMRGGTCALQTCLLT